MKLNESAYLARVKPTLRCLLSQLAEDYPYVSVLGQDSVGMQYSVSSTGTNVSESGMLTKRGFVVRVHNGRGFGEYAFSDITEDDIQSIKAKIAFMASGIKGSDPLPTDDAKTAVMQTEFKIDPEEMGAEEIVSRMTDLRSKALKKSELLLDASAGYVWQKTHKLFLSPNRDLSQDILWSNGHIASLAAKGEEIKDYYRSFSGLYGAELLDEMSSDETLNGVVNTVVELLDSLPIPPGEYECICDPDTTGMIVHEAFGHGVEMDMFVKNRAQAREFINKPVASELVNMHDGATAWDECASYLFDDEGTLGQDTLVIKNGILLGGYADCVSAARLGVKATGNGRRESFERKAYTRMTNTYFEHGNDELADMIKSIKYGFMLENPNSGMEDPKNWGIQCMVNIAREIKDGAFTGKVYSPIVMTGYVPDLLKSISMMSKEIKMGGGGFCGKGYKEWCKVSDGGPYMKARIRLG